MTWSVTPRVWRKFSCAIYFQAILRPPKNA